MYSTNIVSAFHKIDVEVLHVLSQHPEGLTNAQVSAFIGLGVDDPKQWVSYTLLQRLQRLGKVHKDEKKRYHAIPKTVSV